MAGGTQMVFVRFVVNGGIDINNEESNMTTALTALVMKISVLVIVILWIMIRFLSMNIEQYG